MEELNNSGYSFEEISPPTTKLEADELLETIRQCDERIKAAEAQRDEFRALYEQKIARADEQCDETTKADRNKKAALEELLRRFTEANVTDKRKTIKLPTGVVYTRKQPLKFYDADMHELNGYNEQLIAFVRDNAEEHLKRKESVDWLKFKGKLIVDGDVVIYAETGQVLEGFRAQELPDKFGYKLY